VAVETAEGIDEDDEFDDDAIAGDVLPEEAEPTREYALEDVSFEVLPGRALVVLGSSASGKTTLIRLLGGLEPPTSGRILLRGRAAPTIEFGRLVMRTDTSPRTNARLMASLAHVPRRRRQQHVEELLALACPPSGFPRAHDPKSVVKRLAIAAAVDPTADLLFLEDLSDVGDPTFRASCLERVEGLLARGGSVVLATADLALARRLCTDALWLEQGRVVAFGPATGIVERFERSLEGALGSSDGRRRRARGYGTLGSLGGFSVAPREGVEHIRFEIETGEPDVDAAFLIRLSGVEDIVLESDEHFHLLEPRVHAVSVDVPHDALLPGPLVAVVEVVLSSGVLTEVLERADAFALDIDPDLAVAGGGRVSWSVD
jgi:ABC-type polysaccharide/polyol phosphate transport system ATPase subunit